MQFQICTISHLCSDVFKKNRNLITGEKQRWSSRAESKRG